ncbi:hypothetical protein K490DRAFT_66547 [Saccharata proteae CBS 121410]|uniref:RING-type domain-containing protein n=1 Tax=Saccharata proteae CBS 121410 TaxID=1314787 RepID=A0A9P4HWY6_9PEZI|nr:hypothetical protein K490DRAFT_66547 [Saccharata proteae CBS 121410]
MRATVARWLCAAALSLLVKAQTIAPSNTTDAAAQADGIQLLVSHGGGMVPNGAVVPLTNRAANDLDPTGLNGQLFLANAQTQYQINSSYIAYIDCDSTAYAGNIDAAYVLNTVTSRGAAGVLFYSLSSSFCNYTSSGDVTSLPFLFSMSNATASNSILHAIQNSSNSLKYFVTIQPRADADNGTMSGNGGDDTTTSSSNPLGPSPSTAVAMIILYSITGVITALFLVIIITGALRAHRHPERYGPGVVLGGRPRQTRVRGIARAMLDTIPIVKFGERPEPEKPGDVELGEAGTNATPQTESTAEAHTDSTETQVRPEGVEGTQTRETGGIETAEAGIASAAAAASAATANTSNENNEGDADNTCTICTDEFERGQDIRVLPCNHKYHPACIDPWLLNVSGTCPLCRIDLRPTATNDSTRDSTIAPPLDSEDAAYYHSDMASRRRNAILELLHLRPHATADERMAAARTLQQQQAGGDISAENGAPDRGNRRLGVRLHDLLHGRSRRRESRIIEEGDGGSASPQVTAEETASAGERQPQRSVEDQSPARPTTGVGHE